MDKLKQNPFLAAMVGAGALLLILAGVLVYPAWDDAGTIEGKVKALQSQLSMASTDTPGQPDLDSWNDGNEERQTKDEKDYYGKLTGSYKNVLTFYMQYDFNLEWWMTHGAPPDPAKATAADGEKLAQTPSVGDLMSKISDAYKAPEIGIRDRFAKKGVKIGLFIEGESEPTLGFNWEPNPSLSAVGDAEEQRKVLKTLQKRYWIRERVANVCLEKDIRVDCLVDVYFARFLHAKLDGSGVGGHGIDYFGNPVKDKTRFDEFDLPGGLGKTITFGVTVDLPYGEVPKFIRRMLDTDLKPRLLVTVLASRVVVLSQNEPKMTYGYDKYEEKSEKENADLKAAAEKKALEEVKPKPVRLQLVCQVMDFDTAKLPEWAKAYVPDWAKPKP